jgi:hypothetical protein
VTFFDYIAVVANVATICVAIVPALAWALSKKIKLSQISRQSP